MIRRFSSLQKSFSLCTVIRTATAVGCLFALLACSHEGDDPSTGGAGANATAAGPNGSGATTVVSSDASTTTSASTTSASTSVASSSSTGVPCVPVGPETCATAADDDCDGTECSLSAKVYNGTEFNASVQTAAGDIYLVASFSGTLTFGPSTLTSDSQHGSMLAKFSSTGAELWAKRLPTPNGGYGAFTLSAGIDDGAIVASQGAPGIDFGGGPISSTTSGSVVAAFDTDGNLVWAKPFQPPTSGTFAEIDGMGLSPLGDLVLIGSASRGATYDGLHVTNPVSSVPSPSFLLELDAADGTFVWTKNFDVNLSQYVDYLSPRFDSADNIVLAGDYSVDDLDFGGGALTDPTTGENGFLARFDSMGDYIDSHVVGTGEYGFANMVVGPSDEMYISGTTQGGTLGTFAAPTFAGFMSKVEANGHVDWAQYFIQADSNAGIGVPDVGAGTSQVVFADPFRKPITLGVNQYTPLGAWDLLVGKYGADATPLWARSFGAAGALVDPGVLSLEVARIFVAPTGESTLFFDLTGSIDIGSGPLSPVPHGVVIAHLAP